MFITSRRIRTIATALAITITAFTLFHRPSTTRAEPPAPTERDKLLQEQITTLREASNMADELFAKGTGSFADILRLSDQLLDAELKAAPSAKEKITILQSALDAAKKQEALITAKSQAGLIPLLAALEAKAHRLDIEVKLAEQAK